MNEYILDCQYDGRKSFYNKARVVKEDNGNLTLISYSTKVGHIIKGKPVVTGLYSATTTRHIKEFLKQQGFKAETSKQILKDYSEANWFKAV